MMKASLALVCLACIGRAEPDPKSDELRSFAMMLQALSPAAAFSGGTSFPRNSVINRHLATALARDVPMRSPKMAATTFPVRVPEVGTKDDRLAIIRKHFPTAEYMDEFIVNLQAALATPGIGINKENSIPITTLCRDESVRPLQDKIEQVFGQSFNAHGLAGLAYLGHTGMKAAMSHSPNVDGKERYVFFAISHIAIDHEGTIGTINRPGRMGSSACGALIGGLGAVKGADNLDDIINSAGSIIESEDPEFSRLLPKLAGEVKSILNKDMKLWGGNVPEDFDISSVLKEMNLVDITKVAVSLIEEEMLSIIKAVVDPEKADYAVVTGVQIHSSSAGPDGNPCLEFVAPSKAFAVVGGEEKPIDFMLLSQLTSLLDAQSQGLVEQVGSQAAEIEELKKMLSLQSETLDALKGDVKDGKGKGGFSRFSPNAAIAAIACLAGVACGVR